MKNCFAFILMAFSSVSTGIAQQGIIPKPNVLTPLKGSFMLSPSTSISASHDSLLKQAVFFNQHLKAIAGFALPTGTATGNKIVLELKQGTAMPAGGYELMIAANEIRVSGYDAAGLFYGLNNLLFLIPANHKAGQPVAIPAVVAVDAPRFGYRGMMLDVARHFRPVDDVKKVIDRMALLKLNVFHWHLTEDQGWRIEIKKYPKLTEIAAWRDGTIIGGYPGTGNDNQKHGGFYTQEEVKEIVSYAAARHITVIPEIEMPGHSSAAIAAYPFLSCFPDEETVIPKHPSLGAKAKKGKSSCNRPAAFA
ncbi:MAG: family 20 glycosylhydrolase, partial [Chitinophagaceae bacterium]|nr:family 20 glycosylhydrolase [Chitinophagaceae bacterium]